MRGVRRTRHRYGARRSQVGDLWLPEHSGADRLPVVVLIPGGYWRSPYTKTLMSGLARAVVARGWAAWNIEYRRMGPFGGGGGWPARVIHDDLQSSWTATPEHPGLASAHDVTDLVAAVEAARRVSDTVVVYLHWGTELDACPNALQEPLAQVLVKAGADIVVGTHAHVLLGGGYLGSAYVDYGLGNFAFYDNSPPEDHSGSLVITATGRHIDAATWRPAVIVDDLPQPLTGSAVADARAQWVGARACTDVSASPSAPIATAGTESSPAPAAAGQRLSTDGG